MLRLGHRSEQAGDERDLSCDVSFRHAVHLPFPEHVHHYASLEASLDNVWFIAAAWMGIALLASLISIRVGISVALVEIFLGVIGGNFLGFHTTPWIDFLAGTEIEPESFRKHLKPSLVIGGISFLLPFLGAMAFAYFVTHWNLRAAEIAGIALSTTSVAVVYSVMVETGLNKTELGKLLLAACFVTDLGTVIALGVLFASFNIWLLVFIAALVIVLWKLQPITRSIVQITAQTPAFFFTRRDQAFA